ncbi:MAG TPA: EamA family transporter [Legionellaceae bacterium]|nr:EamA family transporter [Legionellaceae bacterium]
MRTNHILLAILAVAIWGCNFIFITVALQDIPPYLLGALRFLFTAIPIIFFLPKPQVSNSAILAYGLFTFGMQFSLLFAGMHAGMPPGLTSLIFQCQVFFSLFLAAFSLRETPSPLQIIGAMISFGGLGLVGIKSAHTGSLSGFLLVIAAAIAMGAGNLFARKLSQVNSYSLVAWGSLVSLPLLISLSLLFEGPNLIYNSLTQVSWVTVGAMAYIVYISTWIGYGIWNNLLRLYTVAAVVPFTLLVPVFGMASSYLIFGEPIQHWKWTAACLIISGLATNVLGSHFINRRQKNLTAMAEKELEAAKFSISDT